MQTVIGPSVCRERVGVGGVSEHIPEPLTGWSRHRERLSMRLRCPFDNKEVKSTRNESAKVIELISSFISDFPLIFSEVPTSAEIFTLLLGRGGQVECARISLSSTLMLQMLPCHQQPSPQRALLFGGIEEIKTLLNKNVCGDPKP